MPRLLARIGVLALTLALVLAACTTPREAPPVKGSVAARPALSCPAPGSWLLPASGGQPTHQDLLAALSRRAIVLLGESHDRAEHHRWQLQVLAGLYAHQPDLVVGFEAFPRSVQPVLDRWSAGALDEKAFLAETRWREVWSMGPNLYLPLLHFVRMNRIPLVALNVERKLVRRVAEESWEAVPLTEREGLTIPKPPSEGYLDFLAEAYRQHREERQAKARESVHGSVPGEARFDYDDSDFQSFVDAQLVWDRAMAQVLFGARRRPSTPLVVGIIGQGHLRHGFGVPWQLADLGIGDVAVLLPYEASSDCTPPGADLADAVFGVDYKALAPARRPRLGVRIERGEDGVRVVEVLAESVAAEAGIRAGDVIVEAAAVTVVRPGDLFAKVTRQAPGTWLPLTVRRDGESIEIVARFPPAP